MRHKNTSDLFDIRPAEKHNARYFAMLNNAVALSGTQFEGGNTTEALAYYEYLLRIRLPNCPLNLNLSDEQSEALLDDIHNLITINTLLGKSYQNDRPCNAKKSLNEIIRFIQTLTKAKSVCYLPSGWNNNSSGHFAGLKLRKLKNGHYAFSVINHGAGLQYHHKVSTNDSKERYLYQSDEYEVDLDHQDGQKLLQHLIELRFDKIPDKKGLINKYSADDLYGLLKLFGKEISLTDKISEKAITPQRTGTCTVTNIHAIARDILIDHGADLKTRKRYHFVMKLRSIIAAYNAYQKDPYDFPRNLITWALKEFSIRLNKEFNHSLTDEEIIFCGKLQDEMQRRLDKDEASEIFDKCKASPFPDTKSHAPEIPKILMTPKSISMTTTWGLLQEKTSSLAAQKMLLDKETSTSPETFLKSIDTLLTKKAWLSTLYMFFSTLPPCSGLENDPHWDKVPADNIGSILEKLHNIVDSSNFIGDPSPPTTHAQRFVLSLIIYDIAAQLAPRLPQLKLGNQYVLGLDDIYSEQTFFTDPIDYYTVKRIVKNFEQRAKNKERILTNVISADNKDYDSTVHYVIQVLLSHIERDALMKNFKLENCTDEKLLQILMINIGLQKKIIPFIHHLIGLSGAAHSVGHHRTSYKHNQEYREYQEFYFNENHFLYEIAKEITLKNNVHEIKKHLPIISGNQNIPTHQDFSENTLYHPIHHLESKRERFKNVSIAERVKQPYQYYLSGSLKSQSESWQFKENERSIYESLDEDFRHIECTPHLQVIRALAWGTTHLHQLQYEAARQRINEFSFQYGRLDDALCNQRTITLMNMERFLHALFTYCKEEMTLDDNLLIWGAELAYHFRYYLEVSAALYHFSIEEVNIPAFQPLLLDRIRTIEDPNTRSLFASWVIRNFRNTAPLSQETASLLLTCRLIAKLGDAAHISNKIWEYLKPELKEALSKSKNLTKTLNEFFHIYLGFKEVEEWQLVASQLISNETDFSIDLEKGELLQAEKKSLKERTGKTIAENKELFTELKALFPTLKLGADVDGMKLYYTETDFNALLISSDHTWEFQYQIKGSDEKARFKIETVFQFIDIENTLNKFELFPNQTVDSNPFESIYFDRKYYQYWKSSNDQNIFFVRQKNSDFSYLYYQKTGLIVELAPHPSGTWRRTQRLLLNLTSPDSSLEIDWRDRLEPLFGTENVRCIAKLSDVQSSIELTRIEHLALNLNFMLNEKEQFMCEEIPGYYLSTQKSLPLLLGFSNIIILENEQGSKKYIIPAFKFNMGEKNNAFNQNNILDTIELCNIEEPYYTYIYQHDELIGDTVNANLYLALLYRSLGDYKNAMRSLKRCETHHNITPSTAHIAKQILIRKIKSPLSAAFDLKLECYLKIHQQKWSENNKFLEPIEFYKDWQDWQEWIKEQLGFYKNTFSTYKMGISFIPSYCRLTEEEFALLADSFSNSNNGINNTLAEKEIIVSERVASASELPVSLDVDDDNDYDNWNIFFNKIKKSYSEDYSEYNADINYDSTSWRLPAINDEVTVGPAFFKIVSSFKLLLEHALSGNTDRLNTLYRSLYALLQNDAKENIFLYRLIAILVYTSKIPLYFNNFNIPKDNISCILEAGNILLKHKYKICKKTFFLLDFKGTAVALTPQKTLTSDFKPRSVKFSIGHLIYEKMGKYPLERVADTFFSKKQTPIALEPFALKLSDLPNATLLEKRLFDRYRDGHEKNRKKYQILYTPYENKKLSDLKNALKALQHDDMKVIEQLENSLLIRANQTPLYHAEGHEKAKAYHLILARAGEQLGIITISDLLTAFLQQKPAQLTTKNHFLTQEDISHLFAELTDYALLSTRNTQINQALDIISKKENFEDIPAYKLQLLGALLDKTRTYDIREFPEFLIYEYATHRLLREDQTIILKKIIALIEENPDDNTHMHHALLQFAAGGGKTSVLIPILAQRFARKGYLPVIFNTNELYQIGLEEIPKNLKASFQQNIEVIERDLEHQWTPQELFKLLNDLKRWREEGKCVLLKSITWHALNLTFKLSFIDANLTGIFWKDVKSVLDFFKTDCVKLEDESHLISDPMQQSIKTYGAKMQKIPENQLDLLMHQYDYLMGNAAKYADIVKLAGIQSNRKRSIKQKELELLQTKLAHKIADDPLFKNINRKNLITYLLQPGKERPQWLIDLYNKRIPKALTEGKVYYFDRYSKEKEFNTIPDDKASNEADLVVLARAFLQTHLPYILTMQYQKDYGASIHPSDLTAAPKHEGKDVTSHFGDHTLVEALTIQLYYQRGLLREHVDQLLNHLLAQHTKERVWNKNIQVPTISEQWLLQFIPEKYSFSSYKDLNSTLKLKLSEDPDFFKHPEVVKRYLTEFVLPQIKVPLLRQTSTAAELQAGFNRSILFSATPGLRETYPAFLKPEHCFLEEAFEAQVIDTLLQSQNRGLCILKKKQTVTEFFDQFPPDLLSKMTTLIDRGALLTQFEAKEVILSYLALDKKHTSSQTAAFFSKKHLHLKSTDPKIQEKDILGAGLVEELKKQHIKPETFLLFLFLDLSKTTGTDIKRPHQDHAGLTVGKYQTVTETIQAAMRERQLLDKDAQSITWILFQSLYREITPNAQPDTFDPRQIFYWMIKNEAKAIHTKIINRAYQGIDEALKSVIFNNQMNASCLEEYQDISPYNIYEISSKEEDTRKVLENYVKFLIKKISKHQFKKFELSDELQSRIEKIIDETAELISTLEDPPKTAINNEVQQEMVQEVQQEQQQEQQQRVKTKLDEAQNFVFNLEKFYLEIDNLDLRYPSLKLPKCDRIKQPELFFNPEHFTVMKQTNRDLNKPLEELKPIKMLLIKTAPDSFPYGSTKYVALTAAGAEYYSFLINNQLLSENESRFALISIDGEALCTSNNTSPTACLYFIKSDECQEMLAYANFLNGNIANPIRLSQLIKKYRWSKEEYAALVEAVSTIHVSHTPVMLLKNPAIEKLCGWETSANKEMMITRVSPRYRPAILASRDEIAKQHLYAADKEKQNLNDTTPPIPRIGRALDGYLFGETPRPTSEHEGDLELFFAMKNIQSLSNPNNINKKDEALLKLNNLSVCLLSSLLSAEEKIMSLLALFSEFSAFDNILETLNKNLVDCQNISHLEILKSMAQTAVQDAYKNFANNMTIPHCLTELKNTLTQIKHATDKKHLSENSFKLMKKEITLFTSPKNELSTVLENTIKELQSSSAITNTSTLKK